MTDAEKIAAYDKLTELLEDRLALEAYFHSTSATDAAIDSVRLSAYSDLVNLIYGRGALRQLAASHRPD